MGEFISYSSVVYGGYDVYIPIKGSIKEGMMFAVIFAVAPFVYWLVISVLLVLLRVFWRMFQKMFLWVQEYLFDHENGLFWHVIRILMEYAYWAIEKVIGKFISDVLDNHEAVIAGVVDHISKINAFVPVVEVGGLLITFGLFCAFITSVRILIKIIPGMGG